MELTLHTEFTFSSAHHLKDYNGKCSNVHGHEWLCEVWFKGNDNNLDKDDILVDFGIVKQLKEQLDHKDLNEVFNPNKEAVIYINPTAENISGWVWAFLKNKVGDNVKIKVKLYESYIEKKAWCETEWL